MRDDNEDFQFAEHLAVLGAEFVAQWLQEARPNAAMAENLAKVTL